MVRFLLLMCALTVGLAVACNEPSGNDLKQAERNAELAFTALDSAITLAENDESLEAIIGDLRQVEIHADSVIYWLRGGGGDDSH